MIYIFLYNLILFITTPLILPYYGFKAFRHGKYLSGLRERFGYLPQFEKNNLSVSPTKIWLHAVSVGEVLAARPLLLELKKNNPNAKFFISTTTETGQKCAREQLGWLDMHFYFPFDFPFVVKKVLKQIQPNLVLIMETEIWPNFLKTCAVLKIPIALVNGRFSDRSFQRYSWIRNGMKQFLSYFELFFMQSNLDAERVLSLGAVPNRVKVYGNLKYAPVDFHEQLRQNNIANTLDKQFLLSQKNPLLIAGSTVEGEEEILLSAFKTLQKLPNLKRLRLLIAPRHPERFGAVEKKIKDVELTIIKRSNGSYENKNDLTSIILLDSIGELTAAYRFATVVFVGGSLVPSGGHNILEPAAAGCPIVTGPYTENFRDIVKMFTEAKALIQLQSKSNDVVLKELVDIFSTLLFNENERTRLGQAAKSLFESQNNTSCLISNEVTKIIAGNQEI